MQVHIYDQWLYSALLRTSETDRQPEKYENREFDAVSQGYLTSAAWTS